MVTVPKHLRDVHHPPERYRDYLDEQSRGERLVLVAFAKEEFVGYLTISWESKYAPFRDEGIPEIADFNVFEEFRATRSRYQTHGRGGASNLGTFADRWHWCWPVVGLRRGTTTLCKTWIRAGRTGSRGGQASSSRPVGNCAITTDDSFLCKAAGRWSALNVKSCISRTGHRPRDVYASRSNAEGGGRSWVRLYKAYSLWRISNDNLPMGL